MLLNSGTGEAALGNCRKKVVLSPRAWRLRVFEVMTTLFVMRRGMRLIKVIYLLCAMGTSQLKERLIGTLPMKSGQKAVRSSWKGILPRIGYVVRLLKINGTKPQLILEKTLE